MELARGRRAFIVVTLFEDRGTARFGEPRKGKKEGGRERKERKFEVSEACGLKGKRTDYRGEMKRCYFIETAVLWTSTAI